MICHRWTRITLIKKRNWSSVS